MTEQPAPPFILRANGWRLGAMNLTIVVIGACLPPTMWLGYRVEDPAAYAIVGTGIVLLLCADFAVWAIAGLRELRIEGDTITAILGWRRRQLSVRAGAVTELHETEYLGRRTLQILLAPPAGVTPGVFTTFPGPKIRLVSDPFDPDEAAEAITRIQALVARARQPPPPPAH